MVHTGRHGTTNHIQQMYVCDVKPEMLFIFAFKNRFFYTTYLGYWMAINLQFICMLVYVTLAKSFHGNAKESETCTFRKYSRHAFIID